MGSPSTTPNYHAIADYLLQMAKRANTRSASSNCATPPRNTGRWRMESTDGAATRLARPSDRAKIRQ